MEQLTRDEAVDLLQRLCMMASLVTSIPDESNLDHLRNMVKENKQRIKEHEMAVTDDPNKK